MLNRAQMYKDYLVEGNKLEDLRDELERLANHTTWVKIHPWQIHLLSFKAIQEEKVGNSHDIKRSYLFYLLDRESLEHQARQNIGFPEVPITTVMRRGRNNESTRFLDEIAESTGLLVQLIDKRGKSYYYGLSEVGLSTFAARAGLRGGRIREKSLFRDAYLAQGYVNANVSDSNDIEETKRIDKIIANGFTLALRKSQPLPKEAEEKKAIDPLQGTGMIIGAFSGDFVSMSPTILTDLYDGLVEEPVYKKAKLIDFSISQQYATMTVEFPDMAKELKKKNSTLHTFTPGLKITNSDCGLSSLVIQGTLRIEETDTMLETLHIKERHGQPLDTEGLLKKIKNDLIKSYEEVLTRIPVLEETKLPKKERELAAKRVVESALRSMPSAKKSLGMKRINVLKGLITARAQEKGKSLFDLLIGVINFPRELEESTGSDRLGETAAMYWLQESKNPLLKEYNAVK